MNVFLKTISLWLTQSRGESGGNLSRDLPGGVDLCILTNDVFITFLASPDALEVIVVTHLLTHSVSNR